MTNEVTSRVSNAAPVLIIGGGLAGLACARVLHRAKVPCTILEASDRVGGRVATDVVDGFMLDRGFQVLLSAYPEAASIFDYSALQLRPFYPGALVQVGSRRYRFADPWKKPLSSLLSLRAPIASVADALCIARLRGAALRDDDPASSADATNTHHYLVQRGLSERVIDRFFRPFFGGVFLDLELTTPSAFFRFVFAMFARGPATLPAGGMQALPRQLADGLPVDTMRLNTRVQRIEPGVVHVAGGHKLDARAIVVATDADAARRLTPLSPPVQWNSTTTVYYDAPRSPLCENILVLNGNGGGLVNHVCMPSDVWATYAPAGRALVSVSIVGMPDDDDVALSRGVLEELGGWFGRVVNDWKLLRVYRIARALPRLERRQNGVLGSADVVICGDHVSNPSINDALESGRRAAELVQSRLARGPAPVSPES